MVLLFNLAAHPLPQQILLATLPVAAPLPTPARMKLVILLETVLLRMPLILHMIVPRILVPVNLPVRNMCSAPMASTELKRMLL